MKYDIDCAKKAFGMNALLFQFARTLLLLCCGLSLADSLWTQTLEHQEIYSLTASNESKITRSNSRIVVVLSLDGFRADYLRDTHTPNIDSMRSVGTSGLFKPCFPSLTFPNHYSMATGLHPDNHGIVANRFRDSTFGLYSIGNRKSVENPNFYAGEPIWNTARRQGLRSAVYFWVGSETPIGGYHPHRWFRYKETTPYILRADSVIAWLSLPPDERPNLIMWYCDEPDHTGHSFGANNPKTYAMVEKMDSLVGYFLDKLRRHPLRDQVDFILVSDHGMASHTAKHSVDLSQYLDYADFELIVDGVPTILYPKEGKAESIMIKLRDIPHIQSYQRETLPKHLQYGKNPRIGSIVILPEIGTYIYFTPNTQMNDGGAHGYDNQYSEMQAIFVAMGHSFTSGREIKEPIPNITLYPLICKLLDLNPAPNDAETSLAQSLTNQISSTK